MYIVKMQNCADDFFVPIPQEVLDKLGIQSGNQLEMLIEGDKLILQKVIDPLQC